MTSDRWDMVGVLSIVAMGTVMVVVCGYFGKGCNGKQEEEETKRYEMRTKAFAACVQAGRDADECKRGMPSP